jgi:hypothetical protein
MRCYALVLLTALFLVGCSAPGQFPAAKEPTALPAAVTPFYATFTPAPVTTKSLTPTTPTAWPTETATATLEAPLLPVPTHTLLEQGPWGMIPAKNGLWVMQADGSGLTQVYGGGTVIQLAISPDGKNAAFIAQRSNARAFGSDLALYGISLPDWEPHLITSLDLKGTEKLSAYEFTNSDAREAGRAVWEATSIAWSPDGRYLAFISAHEGTSADVYVYTAATGEIRRMTDGPSQAYGLSWSPDSRYIFHAGTDFFGTGAGHNITGAWVVSMEEGKVTQVLTPQSGDVRAWEWAGNDTIMVYTDSMICMDHQDLREINIQSGAAHMLWPGCMMQFLFDREKGRVIISNWMENDGVMKKGTFLITLGQEEYRKLSDEGYIDLFPGSGTIDWYGIVPEKSLVGFNEDGQILATYLDDPYKNGHLVDFFPEDKLLFLLDWDTHRITIVQPGGKSFGSMPEFVRSFARSPVDPNLFFFVTDRLYAVRLGEWKARLISAQVEGGKEIYWVP